MPKRPGFGFSGREFGRPETVGPNLIKSLWGGEDVKSVHMYSVVDRAPQDRVCRPRACMMVGVVTATNSTSQIS